jgi:5-methylcytosine-specific restriction endonuclease McrA
MRPGRFLLLYVGNIHFVHYLTQLTRNSLMATAKKRTWKQPPDKTLITSALRRAFTRTQVYRDFIASKESIKRGRGTYRECEHCHQWFAKFKMDVDHIEPVVAPDNLGAGWDEYINRLFSTPLSNLQLLCRPCHRIKSRPEIAARAATRRKLKQDIAV